jgi:hypothetical protein
MKGLAETWWHVDLPNGWRAELQDECVAVFSPTGVGALQISDATSYSGDVADADLVEIALRNGTPAIHLRPVTLGACPGYAEELVDGDTYWRKWHVRWRNQILFITYNCELADRESKATLSTGFCAVYGHAILGPPNRV